MQPQTRLALLAAALLLAACGGGGGDPERGSLSDPTVTTVSLTAGEFTAQLGASASTQPLLQLAGTPTCGVTVQRIRYNTVGGRGENTTASAAVMLPTGSAANCTGTRRRATSWWPPTTPATTARRWPTTPT